jgi:hypothetical protein
MWIREDDGAGNHGAEEAATSCLVHTGNSGESFLAEFVLPTGVDAQPAWTDQVGLHRIAVRCA